MRKIKRSQLRASFRNNPIKAVAVAWFYGIILLPICIPGIVLIEGWEEVEKLYEEVVPLMFWQVE